jgi:hypothetical protein
MYVGSIVTSNRDVLRFQFPSFVSFSVLLATVLPGDWKAWWEAEYIYKKYAKLGNIRNK